MLAFVIVTGATISEELVLLVIVAGVVRKLHRLIWFFWSIKIL